MPERRNGGRIRGVERNRVGMLWFWGVLVSGNALMEFVWEFLGKCLRGGGVIKASGGIC